MDAEILQEINWIIGGGPEHIVNVRKLASWEEAEWEEVEVGSQRYDVHHWLWCRDNTTCGLRDREIKEILMIWGFDPGSANSIMEIEEPEYKHCNIVEYDGCWYEVEA